MRRETLWRVIGGIERRLGQSIEALFPLRSGVQPLDVMEAVERVMADPRNRTPWRDGVIYAPNKYVVHMVCKDEQQRDFLFAFLSDAELARIVRDHAKQEGYRFLTDPEFVVRVYEDAIPEHGSDVLWIEPGWASPESEADAHEQPTEPPPRALLIVEEGPDQGTEVFLRDPLIHIGRSRRMDNTVVLSDTHVSRRHARLEIAPDGSITIENLRADDNPMEINGRPVVRSGLRFGDRVTLGKTTFAVHPSQVADSAKLCPPQSDGPSSE